MIRINLLPVRAAQKKEKLRVQLSILILCVVMVSAACGALYVKQVIAIDGIKEEISDIDRKNNALKKKLGEVADFEKKKQDVEKKLEVLAQLRSAKSGPVRLLAAINQSLPAKVWLESFSEEWGVVNLTGYGDNEETVADFMRNLEASDYYADVELAVTEQVTVNDVKLQKFSLRCRTEKPSLN
jgi:type IV pilus assembly protein PilN